MKGLKKINYFVHPQAICDSDLVGEGTRIWPFSHVLSGAKIGCDVNICEHVFIEGDVVIGNKVTVKSHVSLWDALRVEDNVFIGPGVIFTNDKYPRSKRHPSRYPITSIRKGASIGAGAIILPGVEIGNYALISAGALVTKNVEPFSLMRGSPAQYVGKVCCCGAPLKKKNSKLCCSWGDWEGLRPSLNMRCSKC